MVGFPQLHDGHDVQGPGDAPAERAPPLGAADKGGAPSTLRAQNRSVCRVMICPGFSQDYPLMPKVVLSQGSWGCLIQCAAFSSLTYRWRDIFYSFFKFQVRVMEISSGKPTLS